MLKKIQLYYKDVKLEINLLNTVIINTSKLKEAFFDYVESTLSEKKENESTLISFAYPIAPINIFSIINELHEDYFFWNTPITNETFLGLLPLCKINEFGKERIENTGNKINHFQKKFISNWKTIGLTNIPMVMGGIKFAPDQKSEIWSDYSDSDWFIPKIILVKKNEDFFLIFNFDLHLHDDNLLENELNDTIDYLLQITKHQHYSNKQSVIKKTHSQPVEKWYSIINSVLNNILEGRLKKTVLSREIKLELDKPPVTSEMLKRLSKNYHDCYIFSFKKNNSVFIGASPEKLVKITKKTLEIDALAGSVARGKTEAEDRELEEFLLHSEKNINEQKAVVTFIKELLINISAEINFAEKATIRKLTNIQHLWTPITAKLQNGYMLFDVLKALHPTPAICGTPWDIARDDILKLEEHDRGLYSGNIGWFNFDGDGEFAVGIRSALVKGNIVYAYAGCGIVKGSEPQSEFEESEIKLKPILSLFADEKI